MNADFLKQDFEHLALISLHSEPEPPGFPTSKTLVNHETPLILEEFTSPFVLFPPHFLVLMRVSSCD